MGRSRKRSAKRRKRLRSHKTPTRPLRIKHQAPQIQVPTPTSPESSLQRFVALTQKCWKVVTIGAVFLSLTNILLGWAASVSVASFVPLEPRNPFSAPFAISNDGKFPIYEVQFGCYVVRADYKPPSKSKVTRHVTRLNGFYIGRIGSGETQTIQCHSIAMSIGPIREAEISIQVCFRPLLLPWRTAIERKFITILDSKGHFQWLKQPMTEASASSPCYIHRIPDNPGSADSPRH